jgi:hypothetical protein
MIPLTVLWFRVAERRQQKAEAEQKQVEDGVK